MSVQKLAAINAKASKVTTTSKFSTVWNIVKPFLLLATTVLGALVPKVSASVKIFVTAIDEAVAEGLLK